MYDKGYYKYSLILLLNIFEEPMNFDKENEAAQYAKAKVQEIRSKIYDPILNKAKHISMIHQARFEHNPS